MDKNGRNNIERQRLEGEGGQTGGQSAIDVRLNEQLRGLLGGRKYVKESDLTREIMLEYAKRQGAVTEVDLISVTVQSMGGTERGMDKNGRNNIKRQRLEGEGEQTDGQSATDVRLNEQLRGLLGGRKYVRESDLTREILLEYAKRQGAVTAVDLISVTVQNMGGTELVVKLEEKKNQVKWLKQAIKDEQGISTFTQQLFLVSKSGDGDAGAGGGAGAKQEPMKDIVAL
jgi:hypothetical protein